VFRALGGFDAESFPGWHFYDVDITFRAHLAGYRNYVIPFPVLHGEIPRRGYPWDDWKVAREVFARKFEGKLPVHLQSRQ